MKTDGMDLMRLRRIRRIIRKAEKGNGHYRTLLDSARKVAKLLPELERHWREPQEELAC